MALVMVPIGRGWYNERVRVYRWKWHSVPSGLFIGICRCPCQGVNIGDVFGKLLGDVFGHAMPVVHMRHVL